MCPLALPVTLEEEDIQIQKIFELCLLQIQIESTTQKFCSLLGGNSLQSTVFISILWKWGAAGEGI